MSILKEKYLKEIKPSLKEKFKYANSMQVPSLKKIVISMGIGDIITEKGSIQDCVTELSDIAGQKPVLTKSRQSISNFKIRKGQPIGLKVTLRGERMYDFAYRFFNIVCPRIRDFRGFKKKCDGRGNYSLGLEDQQIFPEVNLDAVKRTQGMNICFVTSAVSDAECLELLKQLGLPFRDQ